MPALAAEIIESAGKLPATCSIVSVNSKSVIVEAFKQAEEGEGLVLRSFDSHGSRGNVCFAFGVAVASAAETDLLEENGVAVEMGEVGFRPYEIKTHGIII